MRQSNNKGIKSYEDILMPILKSLFKEREKFGSVKSPITKLFTQFHAPQTKLMKKYILEEIKKPKSNIRVIFATTALRMSVNTLFVSEVIHITPPGNLLK